MQNYSANTILMPSHLRQLELKLSYFKHKQTKQYCILITGKNEWYIGPCLDKFRNYKIYVTAKKGVQQRNCVNFFPTKSRLPNTDSIDRLSAALEDLKHECTLSNTNHPVVKSRHGTDLNKAIKRRKEIF